MKTNQLSPSSKTRKNRAGQFQQEIRTIIRIGKIPCYMRDSASRWLIVRNAKIF